MKAILCLAVAAALAIPVSASAQVLGKESMAVTQGKMPGLIWSAKPTMLTPYVAPNKPHWKLSEILAAHKGQSDWVQPLVRNREHDADYISLGAGKKQSARFYADRPRRVHRMGWRHQGLDRRL